MALATSTMIAAGLAAGAIGGSLLGGRKQNMPTPLVLPPPPEPQRMSDPRYAEARRRRRLALSSAPKNTRSGTLLTGPAGINSPPPQAKTLLGG
jgi:hypothetical protein